MRIRLYGVQRRNDNALGKKMAGGSGNEKPETGRKQLLFGIVQGATFDDVRKSSAQALTILTSLARDWRRERQRIGRGEYIAGVSGLARAKSG